MLYIFWALAMYKVIAYKLIDVRVGWLRDK